MDTLRIATTFLATDDWVVTVRISNTLVTASALKSNSEVDLRYIF